MIDVAVASNALGQLHRLDGDFDAAEPLYEQTVALGRELATAEIVAVGLLNLAMVAIGRGRPEPAWQLLLEVFAVLDNTESAAIGQSVLEVASGLAASRGEWQRSARFLGVVDALTENTGMRRDPADEAFLRPLVENARGCLGDAAFAQALADGRRLSLLPAMHEARDWLSGKG